MRHLPWLTLLVFWPLLGALFLPAVRRSPAACRTVALAVALVEALLAGAAAWVCCTGNGQGWALHEDAPWIPSLGIRYTLALDGLSLLFVALTALVGVLCVLVSWKSIRERTALFYALVLASLATIQGVFLATDLFLFALFWEAQLIPVFFLIGIFGHGSHGDRIRIAVKFFLFSSVGGLLMFLAVIGLGLYAARSGTPTFALEALLRARPPQETATWLYAAFLLSFAIKIPLVPVHMWLPDAHTEAPTAGSLILAALLLKTGGYALIRFAVPLFPQAAAASTPLLLALGLIGLFFASAVALVQEDVKRLVAYSSIGHMGLAVAGVAAGNTLALSGAVIMMVSHGLTTGGLFSLAGMIGDRLGSRRIEILGGLWNKAPRFGAALLYFILASAALPGLSGFVGEAMIVFGLFRNHALAGVLAVAGMAVTLAYLLRLARDTLYGPARSQAPFADLSPRETLVLACLALAVLLLGLFPGPALAILDGPLRQAAQAAGWPGM